MTRSIRCMLVIALPLVALACEKSTPPPTSPSPDSGAPPVAGDDGAADATADGAAADGAADGGETPPAATEPGAPDVAWHDKTFQQKKEFMGVYVFPKMKASFQGHDATTFKKFTCDTCHGDDGKARNYEMPNPGIFPLSKDDPLAAGKDYDEAITKFMSDEVVPQMAELLQEKAGPDGFWCMECHPAG